MKYVNKLTGLKVFIFSLIGKVPIAANVWVFCIESLRFVVSIMPQILIILLYLAPSFINHPLCPLDEIHFGRGFLLQSGFRLSFFFLFLD